MFPLCYHQHCSCCRTNVKETGLERDRRKLGICVVIRFYFCSPSTIIYVRLLALRSAPQKPPRLSPTPTNEHTACMLHNFKCNFNNDNTKRHAHQGASIPIIHVLIYTHIYIHQGASIPNSISDTTGAAAEGAATGAAAEGANILWAIPCSLSLAFLSSAARRL